ncbi:aldose 1-epimerase family protein [uncultured Sphingomonas sp.]|uniref:aldose 1-epimerase family protein n=1 Tax=uncultured Sphingomonas sp. TaxID=158754 RepID=UPI0035CA7650
MICIASDRLSAVINPLGAELTTLRDGDKRDLMTDADPAFWTGHAPILFPIVGRLNQDMLRVDGAGYAMKQHGFARRQMFDVMEQDTAHALFRLTDNEETRAQYPFGFALDVAFTISAATLTITAQIANPGKTALPASLGFHPAFAWPLPYGAAKETHRIVFDADEPGAVKQLADGLMAGERPSPLSGRILALRDALFADDALIWDPVHAGSVTYGPPSGQHLRIDFPDTPQLGLWTKPGAAFVCIEPWHGHADPAGFTGDFRDKPGMFEVPPGGEWRCAIAVTLVG